MLENHPQIKDLEGPDGRVLPLLIGVDLAHLCSACVCGSLHLPLHTLILLSTSLGAMLSLWQLNLLHDVIHGNAVRDKELQRAALFWGSMPSVFGYFLYLRFGHLSHHRFTGEHSVGEVFASSKEMFEDGDVLFVGHRLKVKGSGGPPLPDFIASRLPADLAFKPLSIALNAFDTWKEGDVVGNALKFTLSFSLERLALCINDKIVALTSFNLFFPNKPHSFHAQSSEYARASGLLQLALLLVFGWQPLLYLFLAEISWSLPFHPASAMFISNHPSAAQPATAMIPGPHQCQPTSSTYAGVLYDLLCLNTNYHTEHHDHPTISLFRLPAVKRLAPEFYGNRELHSGENPYEVIRQAFSAVSFYSCMDSRSTLLSTNRRETG